MHQFRSDLDGRRWRVLLPRDAVIHVRAGQTLAPAELWCQAMPELPPHIWRQREWHEQWRGLGEVFPHPGLLGHLQQVWFGHQQVRLPESPEVILFPCELVSIACHDLPPLDLWWDLTPAVEGFMANCEAFALPPIPLRRWKELRIGLPGDVELDASVGEHRFTMTACDRSANQVRSVGAARSLVPSA